MVVVQAEPSTSTPVHKKTRRSTKKRAPRLATADGEDIAMDGAPAPAPTPNAGDDELMIDDEEDAAPTDAPDFGPAPASVTNGALKSESRRIPIPPHRMTPLKKEWVNIFGPLTEMLGLQVRMNVQRKAVEIRVGTVDLSLVSCSWVVDIKTHKRSRCSAEGCGLRQGVCTWI